MRWKISWTGSGKRVGESYLFELGKKTINLEREFNRQAGFTPADDRPTEWMTREKLPLNDMVFDVPECELDSIFD